MLEGLPPFLSAPTSCQFAKGGAWESAWSFPGSYLPSELDVRSYLTQSTEVAFEAFFGRSFFGVRATGSPVELEAFATKCLRAFRAQRSFFAVLREELGVPTPGRLPAFAEVGCVNAWRSVGAVHILEPHRALAEFERIWLSVLRSPVGQNTSHTKAIEFAFERPVPHWFGLPISGSAGSNLVSEASLRQALELLAPTTRPTANAP